MSSSFGEVGKTLSRNALYTPIEAYSQNQVDPSQYMGSKKSVPKSLQESSLFAFLQSVSYDYHKYIATAADPKNNGSRPSSLNDVQEHLRQRAITLIGGGINSSGCTSTVTEKQRRKRKRKRQSWKQFDQLRQNKRTTKVSNRYSDESTRAFLYSINKSWNEYIVRLLGLKENTASDPDVTLTRSMFSLYRNDLEITGAHVVIMKCTQQLSLEGTRGILVGESKNTWTVACLVGNFQGGQTKRIKKETETEKPASSNEKTLESHQQRECVVRLMEVPKRGSTVTLMIPIGVTDAKKERKNITVGPESAGASPAMLEPSKNEEKGPLDNSFLGVQVGRCICITLDPSPVTV